jgi:hypothetical protein
MVPHYFGKLDPHKMEKLDLDPDPHENQSSGSLRLKMEPWRALEAHNGGVEAQQGARKYVYQWWSQIHITLMRNRIRIRIKVKSPIRIRIQVKRGIRIRILIKVMRRTYIEWEHGQGRGVHCTVASH